MAPKKGPSPLLGLSFQGDSAALFRLIAERIELGEVTTEQLGWKLTEQRLRITVEINMQPEIKS